MDRCQQRRKAVSATTDHSRGVHAVDMSPGRRNESASATWAGATSLAPPSAAIVRATRATRALPRPDSGKRSTAFERSWEASSVRRGAAMRSRSRATTTRSRTACEASPGGAASSARSRSGHGDREIESVEQRPRQLLPVRGKTLRRAPALQGSVPASSAGAHVHGSDELKTSREQGVPTDARDRDDAVLQRLAEGLEHRTRELRELVEQKHAAVGERDLTGSRAGAASDDRRRRGSVMWRPERRRGDERASRREEPGDRVDARDLERLLPRQRRQDPRQPARQHRLAGARRPDENEVVGPGSCNLERATSSLLAPDIGEIVAAAALQHRVGKRLVARYVDLAAEVRDDLGQVPYRHRLDPGQRGLGGRICSADDAAQPDPLRALGDRQRSGHGPHPSVERELAHRGVLRQRSGGSCRVAASTANEMGRSKPEPSLRSAAGARLTVIRRLSGHSSAADTIPLRTRCLASWHARSASPTIAKPGMPGWTCASTSTFRGSRPTRVWVTARASTQTRVGTKA